MSIQVSVYWCCNGLCFLISFVMVVVMTNVPVDKRLEAFTTLFPFLIFFPCTFYYAIYSDLGFQTYPIIVVRICIMLALLF